MKRENIGVSEEVKKAIEKGCHRCKQNTHFITHIVVQRILTHTKGELHFSVDERCRKPNDGSVIYVECEMCGLIISE